MDEFDQVYAACIIEYARRQDDGVLKGPFYVIGKEARDAFDLPYSANLFQSALSILETLGALTRYSRAEMQPYYRVDSARFDGAMDKGEFGVRQYTIMGGLGSPSPEYAFLDAYSDLGVDYLRDAIETYSEAILAIAEQEEADSEDAEDEDGEPSPAVDSSSWTGRDGRVSEPDLSIVVMELDRAEAGLEKVEASQHDKAQARALIIAARALAEAPDPQSDLVWELIARANALAGIGSLFVSIIALFTAAAH